MDTVRIGSVTYHDATLSHEYTTETISSIQDLHKDLRLVIFWGGEDLNPWFYGEPNTRSYCDTYISNRDATEWAIASQCAEMEIPMLGICRGAQLLCANAGGKLWQHVDNHAYGSRESHKILTKDGDLLMVNSAHHQMMRPPDHAIVLANSHVVRSPVKYDGEGRKETNEPEAEIVYFPSTNALSVQPHPEWLPFECDLRHYLRKLTKDYFDVSIG